jgi:hypothetical protein
LARSLRVTCFTSGSHLTVDNLSSAVGAFPRRPGRSFRVRWRCALAHAKELAETAETDAAAADGGRGVTAVADRVFTELLEVAASPRDDRFSLFAGD